MEMLITLKDDLPVGIETWRQLECRINLLAPDVIL